MGEGVGWEGFASIERGFRGQRVGRGEDWDHVSGSPGSGAIGETGSQAQAKPRGGPTLCERLIVVGNRESCDRGKENKRWGMSDTQLIQRKLPSAGHIEVDELMRLMGQMLLTQGMRKTNGGAEERRNQERQRGTFYMVRQNAREAQSLAAQNHLRHAACYLGQSGSRGNRAGPMSAVGVFVDSAPRHNHTA
jgi:hypothetical protein